MSRPAGDGLSYPASWRIAIAMAMPTASRLRFGRHRAKTDPPVSQDASVSGERQSRTGDSPEDSASQDVRAERAVLIIGCIEIRRVVSNRALDEKLRRLLEQVGVTAMVSDGEMFDPERHYAIGTVDTPDPLLDRRIASTEQPGYLDHGRVLQPPEVVVYQAKEQAVDC